MNLLVEKEGYLSVISSSNASEDIEDVDIATRYDEMRYLRKRSLALRNEMIKYVNEVDQEMKKVSLDFNRSFENASEEELNNLVELVEKEKERLKQEYSIDKNKDIQSYIKHYEEFIPDLKDRISAREFILKK